MRINLCSKCQSGTSTLQTYFPKGHEGLSSLLRMCHQNSIFWFLFKNPKQNLPVVSHIPSETVPNLFQNILLCLT